MFRKKDNLFSAGKRRRRGQDYRNASIGPNMGGYDAKGNTHTARSVKKTKPVAPASPDGQPQRRARSFTPGEIGYVNPRSSTRETVADYSRRQQRHTRSLRPPRDIPVRTIGLLVLAVIAAVAIAAGVASCVFSGSVNSRLALQDSSVAEALVKPENADDPFYLLVAGEFEDPAQPDDGPDVLMLARVDVQAGKATLVSIPSNLIWTLTDGTDDLVSREVNVGGDAGLVKVVSNFAGVGIAHFAKVDSQGFVALVDELGGIDVEVTEEADDPDAGSIYVPAGRQTLDGAQALTLCRAKNYLGSYDTRAQNQMKVLMALVQKATSGTGLGAQQSMLDTLAGTFQTDLSVGELSSLLATLGQMEPADVRTAVVPGYYGYEGGQLRFTVGPNGWKAMMEKVDAGGDPNEKSQAVESVNPGSYSLTVKNGSGVTGAANQVAEVLQQAGYRVEATGNTDQFAYGETLVVYKDDAHIAAAQAVVDTLGVGRAVEAGIYYEFDTDLQVIVGQDWKPRS